jgi:hypothetical protein
VQFSLPAVSAVKVGVFDINGRCIRTLLDRRDLKAGSYSLAWNGLDANQRAVAGGVYFYRLETRHGTLAAKVIKLD